MAGCLGGGEPAVSETQPEPGVGADAALPDPVTGMEWLLLGDEDAAMGIYDLGDFVYLSGTAGLRIYDLSDPTAPDFVGGPVEGTQVSEDVEAFVHPKDNQTYAVISQGRGTGAYATGNGAPAVTLINVTDPREPEIVARVTDIGEAHNIAVVPGTAIVYVSHSTNDGGLGQWTPSSPSAGKIDIIDFTDPLHPTVRIKEFPLVSTEGATTSVVAPSCHDVTFNQELQRGYCSAITQTIIWDTSDPLEPREMHVITWPFNTIHHGAWDAMNGTILIMGDEHASIFAGTGPICSPDQDYPTAGLWFFDITDVSDPQPLDYFTVKWDAMSGASPAYCSVHFGEVIHERDLFVTGWYAAGTVLVDFSDPADVKQVAQFHAPTHAEASSTGTWEAREINGHVVTGDTARGMDVLRLV
jgi:hypothetical protein